MPEFSPSTTIAAETGIEETLHNIESVAAGRSGQLG